MHVLLCIYTCVCECVCTYVSFLDGYCSTVQGLLDWFEVDLGVTELLFIQIDLCVMCVSMCVRMSHVGKLAMICVDVHCKAVFDKCVCVCA